MKLSGDLVGSVDVFVSPDENCGVVRSEDRAEGSQHLGLVGLEPGRQAE